MKKVMAFLYFWMFMALVAWPFVAAWLYWQEFFWVTIVMMGLMFAKSAFKLDNPVTRYAMNYMLTLDQTWQVVHSPLLNLGVSTKHKFGAPDETASSVVGKNLEATNGRHWILIEFMLSTVLEGGKPHALKSREFDEGY